VRRCLTLLGLIPRLSILLPRGSGPGHVPIVRARGDEGPKGDDVRLVALLRHLAVQLQNDGRKKHQHRATGTGKGTGTGTGTGCASCQWLSSGVPCRGQLERARPACCSNAAQHSTVQHSAAAHSTVLYTGVSHRLPGACLTLKGLLGAPRGCGAVNELVVRGHTHRTLASCASA